MLERHLLKFSWVDGSDYGRETPWFTVELLDVELLNSDSITDAVDIGLEMAHKWLALNDDDDHAETLELLDHKVL
jgi:hypothetical protein